MKSLGKTMNMKLSSSEKPSLLSSLVVGCLVGTFIAYAAVAFNSESKLQGIAISDAQLVGGALLGFFLSAVSTIGLLGVLPIVLLRKYHEGKRNA